MIDHPPSRVGITPKRQKLEPTEREVELCYKHETYLVLTKNSKPIRVVPAAKHNTRSLLYASRILVSCFSVSALWTEKRRKKATPGSDPSISTTFKPRLLSVETTRLLKSFWSKPISRGSKSVRRKYTGFGFSDFGYLSSDICTTFFAGADTCLNTLKYGQLPSRSHTDASIATSDSSLEVVFTTCACQNGTAAIEAGCLVEKMIVELASETSPGVLVLPDQDTRVEAKTVEILDVPSSRSHRDSREHHTSESGLEYGMYLWYSHIRFGTSSTNPSEPFLNRGISQPSRGIVALIVSATGIPTEPTSGLNPNL
ncbi:unnamed protein product [Thlaspi arvense]|uniref:Uncharacterized protein n=1 Tax=Thlaspi arvense TaxID=13288 RepID=A0AAU9RI34_THLAR|nr:unnamed protein product [Thlaspi arvense]